MNMQQTETMLNLTRFNTIQKCINIHFGKHELFGYKIQYNKMNETNNNER